MAYSKKVSRRYRRSGRTRRYTRRRRYRRKYPRRSGKRFPKGVEVKSKSVYVAGSVSPVTENSFLTFYPGHVTTIGSSGGANNLAIEQGTSQGQRVGAKIEPIKLRISGAFQLEGATGNVNGPPNFWQVRLLVYQVKGGNASNSLNSKDYHQMAIVSDGGVVGATQLDKIFAQYSHNTDNSFSEQQWKVNNFIGKVPLRRGIGGLCRVLYKKTFWINTQKNPIKQFRIVTKTPRRIIYPEQAAQSGADNTQANASNGIYVLWVFQPGSVGQTPNPVLNYSYYTELYYTDK